MLKGKELILNIGYCFQILQEQDPNNAIEMYDEAINLNLNPNPNPNHYEPYYNKGNDFK